MAPRKRPLDWTYAKWVRFKKMQQAKWEHWLLIQQLGGVCEWCGEDGSNCPLTIDHVDGRDVANHDSRNRAKRWDVRVKDYIREFYEGIRLRVLCHTCNSKDGRRRQMEAEAERNALPTPPF